MSFPAHQRGREEVCIFSLVGHVNTSYLIGRAADFRGRREMDRGQGRMAIDHNSTIPRRALSITSNLETLP